jgi:energy-coupling factor transporter ATP-binding protein EcfA2
VLFDVNFEVRRGEVLALLGTNGAGKSTILRVVSGLGVPERGVVRLDGREHTLAAAAIVDDSAGYHERRTWWRWSAGIGRAAGGERLAWNLVTGVHDGASGSERTVWVDGEPREVGPVEFEDDLSRVGSLRFSAWCAREHRANRILLRTEYRQPFGSFSGELPGGPRLAEGYGVMEEHDVRW